MLKKEELENIRALPALCELVPSARINGVGLDYRDFGDKYDAGEENAEPYCCANMQFIPFDDVKEETLIKYNITEIEYRQIQEKLDCLSFGCCVWCE